MLTDQDIQIWTTDQFVHWLAGQWKQGEHVALVGPTGSGKTTIAEKILAIRKYVCVLAVKRYDDTLNQFKKDGYQVIKKWPPEYGDRRVILWAKPDTLQSLANQATVLHNALEHIYISGGWCIYFDEAGYIAGHLKLHNELGVLLNQGRSSHISVVCAMTRPHSMVARIPAETLNQCRHILIFKYTDEREMKAAGEICGISFKQMTLLQQQLSKHDFIYAGKGHVVLVRN